MNTATPSSPSASTARCSRRSPMRRTNRSPRASAISSAIYGSTFFMATGFHGMHVIIGTTVPDRVPRSRDRRPLHAGAPFRLRSRRLVLALRRRGVAVPLRLHLRVWCERSRGMNDVRSRGSERTVGPLRLAEGTCPRCGKGQLFRGYLSVSPLHAHRAGSTSRGFEAGDGPAVFVILIVGAIVAGGALITEVAFQPPYWVHALDLGAGARDPLARLPASAQGGADRAAVQAPGRRRPQSRVTMPTILANAFARFLTSDR